MNTKRKPILGETLFRLDIRRRPRELVPVKVAAVGRKYFTCRAEGDYTHQHSVHWLNDWREKTDGWSQNQRLYETRQEWADLIEADRLREDLRSAFAEPSNPFTLEILRAVKALINPNHGKKAASMFAALLASCFTGCGMPMSLDERMSSLPRPVVIVTANADGVLLRGSDNAVLMIPPDYHMARTIHAQGLKPGDVLLP